MAASAGRAAYIAGTFDTKGRELFYLRNCLEKLGVRTVTVDLADVGQAVVGDGASARSGAAPSAAASARCSPATAARAVTEMAVAFEQFVTRRRDLGGLISAGGSGGTALATPAMRRLPIGVPKVMVSTVASGDVKPYVGPSDICMMYSVTDVAGINRISESVLANAAHALAGMIAYRATGARPRREAARHRPHDVRPDHAVRAGGDARARGATTTASCSTPPAPAASRWRSSSTRACSSAVIDVTTTEIADEIVGGVLTAGPGADWTPSRARRVPYVGSCGALDMVNFWAMDTVPGAFQGRQPARHNPNVTLMRTTPEESARIGRFIVDKLNRMEGPVRFLIPEGGVLGPRHGRAGPFWDPAADRALFDVDRVETSAPAPNRKLDAPAAPHQRRGVRGRAGRRLPRDRRVDPRRQDRPHGPHRASRHPDEAARAWSRAASRSSAAAPAPGLSAKCEEAGGIDLIVIYNSGRYRMAGRGSLAGLLAYGNANEIVVDMAREVLPVVTAHAGAGRASTAPIRSCCAITSCGRLGELGFSGVQNFPTVGLFDGVIRAQLEETGMGYALEVRADPSRARSSTCSPRPTCSREDDARAMAQGRRRHRRVPPGPHHRRRDRRRHRADAADCVPLHRRAGRRRRARSIPDMIVLCHGGPIATPGRRALHPAANCRECHGFYGASSMERLPTETALTETTRTFKRIGYGRSEERVMTGTQFGQFILGLIVVAAVVAIVVWLLNWLYLRSSKERAFVRTGLGGQKVVHERRRLRAADRPRGDPGQHEHAAPGGRRAGATRRSSPRTACAWTSSPSSTCACRRRPRRSPPPRRRWASARCSRRR